jgi:hypothetical protein
MAIELYDANDCHVLLKDSPETDLTNQWVVINPVVMVKDYKAEYVTKEIQVAKATGGFGCTGSKLSSGGGKVFITRTSGETSWIYRNELLGIAGIGILEEMGIEE